MQEIRFYPTLEVTLNYTFDTDVEEDVDGVKRLTAEIKLIIRIQKAGRKLIEAIIHKVDEAFEQYIIEKFSERFGRNKDSDDYKRAAGIADGIMDVNEATVGLFDEETISRFNKKVATYKDIHDLIPEILKIGVFFRLTDEEPNIRIEDEYAKPVVYGEWKRGVATSYEYSEPFLWTDEENRKHIEITGRTYRFPFDLSELFKKKTFWNKMRSPIIGGMVTKEETTWKQLKRILVEKEI